MAKRPRDYAAEYARRIAKGLGLGQTRSQARGHAAPSEPKPSLLKRIFGEARAPRTENERSIIDQLMRRPGPQPEQRPTMPQRIGGTGAARQPAIKGDQGVIDRDNDIAKQLRDEIRDSKEEHGGTGGLTREARDYLNNPSYTAVFDQYWRSASIEQDVALKGLKEVTDFRVVYNDDGSIDVYFDYEWESDDGEYHGTGHAHAHF